MEVKLAVVGNGLLTDYVLVFNTRYFSFLTEKIFPHKYFRIRAIQV